MDKLLTATLTFLMTDIQDSTVLWDSQPEAMRAAMVMHDAVIESAVVSHNGEVVRPRGEGDSRFAVFAGAGDAVRAAVDIQRAFNNDPAEVAVSIRVRCGVHTGAADLREGDYYGSTVNRCARIRGLGHGGQTLLSQATAELVRDELPDGISLVDLGSHRLKGLSRPEAVFQLWIPDLPNEFPPLASANAAVNNLPELPRELIGREEEQAALSALLARPDVRLVTITGPGGTGKTSLSLAVGHDLLDAFPHGVYFVDLAPITEPELIGSTIARALGLREGGGRPPLDNLKDYLADKRALVILDNLEQVITAAPIIADLLAAAPGIRLLATSRIPLQVRGEREFPLETLTLPPHNRSLSLKQIGEFESVQLFVRSAQAIRPSFELTPENAAAVAEICRRLDGLPLALEIAAARIRMMSPQAILKRLDKRLELLVGGAADLPTRQQTLRGAIDWSYKLLDPADQKLLARLGVFVGGFSLESAEAVANADGSLDIFAGIETLLSNSLLRQVDSPNDEPRFDMLQTIRDYALEKLAESGELNALQQAHMWYFAQQPAIMGAQLFGGKSTGWLPIIDMEHDNIRAALAHALLTPETAPLTAEMCAYLLWFWYRYGHFHEGREWSERSMAACAGMGGAAEAASLEAAAMLAMWEGDLATAAERSAKAVSLLQQVDNDLLKAAVNMAYGVCLINQGFDREAHGHLKEATELFDDSRDRWGQATTLVHMGNAALGLGEYELAQQWLDKALPIAQAVGDPWQIAFCLNNFGEVARAQDEIESARHYYDQTEATFRKADATGDHARLIHTSGYIAYHDGDRQQADALFRQSLAAFRELGNKRGMAECLAGLAVISNDPAWAVPLLSAASAQMAVSGAAWWPADRVEIERAHRRLNSTLGEQEFERLWAIGQRMTLDEGFAWVTSAQDEA